MLGSNSHYPYCMYDYPYDMGLHYDYYDAYSFFFSTENSAVCKNFQESTMPKRDLKSTQRERLSSSGSSSYDLSEDELATTSYQLDNEFVNDPRLLQAANSAAKENTMLPLIKEELRCTILHRRSQQGLGEIVDEEKKPIPKKPMTPQEKDRKMRRQEQNRRAAKKCRKKKKDMEVSLLQAYHAEKDKQAGLEAEVNKLTKEKEELQEMLDRHMQVCSSAQSLLELQNNLQSQSFIPSSTGPSQVDIGLSQLTTAQGFLQVTTGPYHFPNEPLYGAQSPDIISPGPSEPFTPGMDNDGRYFMYPDINEDICKPAPNAVNNADTCGTVGEWNEGLDIFSGNNGEECVDIQSLLNNASLQTFSTAAIGENLLQIPDNPGQVQTQLQLPPLPSHVSFTETESNNESSDFLTLFSFPDDTEINSAPVQQDDEMMQSGLMHYEPLPFSDMSDVNGNRQ